MKALKIKKRMLKDNETLLRAVGAVFDRQAYPTHVYLSNADYKLLKANITRALKKQNPGLNGTKLDYALGVEMLNLGPSERLKDAVRPGFVLVDEAGIERERLND